MGFLAAGRVLHWNEAEKVADYIKEHGEPARGRQASPTMTDVSALIASA